MIGGDYSPSTSAQRIFPLPPLPVPQLQPPGFFSGAIFSGTVTINFAAGGMTANMPYPSPSMLQLFPSPVQNESTEISPAGSQPEVPLLICAPPLPPENVFAVNNSNQLQQAPLHASAAAAAAASEDDDDSDEPSLTQPRASFSQSIRDLPTKRNRIQSSWYN